MGEAEGVAVPREVLAAQQEDGSGYLNPSRGIAEGFASWWDAAANAPRPNDGLIDHPVTRARMQAIYEGRLS